MGEKEKKTSYKKSLTSLTYAAMLIAIGVILGFLKLPLNPFIEIRFQQIPVAISGAFLGPFYGGAVGALTDILSYIVHPTGEFFPGFTISSALTGVIFALFMYKKPFSFVRILMASLVNSLVTSFLLNCLWLSILYNTTFSAAFLMRLPKNLIMIPVDIIIFSIVSKIVYSIFQRSSSSRSGTTGQTH